MKTSMLLLSLLTHFAFPVKHSLKYVLTSTYGINRVPQFFGVAMVDEVPMGYCDSNRPTPEAKTDWLKRIFKEKPKHFDWYVGSCLGNQHTFKDTMDTLMQRFNQTEGAHIFQRMSGCEWDDETGEVIGFMHYGYDGEDFLAFDLKTLTWIAPKPQAVITKLRWDAEKSRTKYNQNYLAQICPEWLKMYVDYGKSALMRTDLPSVSLLQKSPSSPVSCHATGFYPDRAMMFWRKDGEEIHEDVDHGEILPNHDGSFQMSVDLDLSSVPPEDWRRYDCVFHLSGVKDDIITKLDKAVIRTNWVSPSQFPAGAVIGVVVGLLLLLTLCITGLCIWRRNNHGFRPANTSDCSASLDKNLSPN
ncbi:major histocompatibility complex class I-related gene protein-like isoform X2 [Epinephelus fuscoguttatus]|uniref:major histocompatibility complex class I-related gene protein-like isoform X2 n=2 Tax=Epinephelus fuscoguttatus TaxID=293821 RepID=UPI0020D00A54|nr:major histocompatibility complex class I-related gene protein-like isoform X2 [Epinephelus fuscoguttatus]XP_049460568.1 major histocompatibility complex class I-related gene protein-like isoform X2 [Epinephelus fuscoguttatus]